MENQELIKQVTEKAEKWLTPAYDAETQAEVKRMLENEDKTELIEAFYKDLEFGTGGLRGIMGVGSNRMNIYTVGAATQGLSNYLKKNFKDLPQISVVVGHDCRNNSRLFAETSANIFSANGIKVYLFDDMRPTPEMSFAIRHLGCQSGIILTASHNPKEYNGYKAYWDDGAQVLAPHDAGIIDEVNNIASAADIKFKGRLRTTFRFLLPRITKIGQETIATSLCILVRFHQRGVIPYSRGRNHEFRFGFDCIQGTDYAVCYRYPAIEKLLFMFRRPALIDRSACQIYNDITMRQRLNQKSGHTFPKHRSSQRNDPVSTLFGQIVRKMFAYISGGSGHCYIHLDSPFFNYTRETY